MATQIQPMMTQNEFQALMYLAVGVKSEGSIEGRSVAYKLSLAGNIDSDGTIHPKYNSGYYC